MNNDNTLILCSKCARKMYHLCVNCSVTICGIHTHYIGNGLPFCSQDCIDKYLEKRIVNYCCSEMAELRELQTYTTFRFNWDEEISMQGNDGGYDSEEIPEAKFLVNFCQFCGARLIK